METLDPNELESLAKSVQRCSMAFLPYCPNFNAACPIFSRCPSFGASDCNGEFRHCVPVRPMFKRFVAQLTLGLKRPPGKLPAHARRERTRCQAGLHLRAHALCPAPRIDPAPVR